MAYSKKRTLGQKLTLANRKVDLPRDTVIDDISLLAVATLKNTGINSWTGKLEDVLKAIELRLVSDGSNVHYAVSALDVVIINHYTSKGNTVDINSNVTVNAGQTATVEFPLLLHIGEILAPTKDSLEINIGVTQVAENVVFDNLEITITLIETVMTFDEFIEKYGPNLEYAAEPKIYAITKSFPASNELAEVLDLPTGTLLRMAFIVTRDANEARTNVEKLGIIVTTPDRRELYAVDGKMLQYYNKVTYDVDPLTGCYVIDYGKEITNDELGIRGWKFNKGDYQLAIKNASPGSVRYISVEFVVNTEIFA